MEETALGNSMRISNNSEAQSGTETDSITGDSVPLGSARPIHPSEMEATLKCSSTRDQEDHHKEISQMDYNSSRDQELNLAATTTINSKDHQ
jgi:hypothetical protein